MINNTCDKTYAIHSAYPELSPYTGHYFTIEVEPNY